MNEWNIQTRGHHCQSCQRPFVDKERYHTLLFESKDQLERSDICATCWENQYSHGSTDRKGFLSYWQGIYELPPPPPPEPIKKETAETLLRKLTELNDPRYAAAAYILAVMLERKRLLKVKEQLIRDHRRVFVYEHPRTGDLFTIPDPNLQLDQLTQVQHDVAHLMEHGLPSSAPEDPSASLSDSPATAQENSPPPTAAPTEISGRCEQP